jgi:hypothetical protein
MPKTRTAIPKSLRDGVLHEFNYRCAICGRERPHLHHIDENRENNVSGNLLPLCPNHHLSDQHDPTRQVDPLLLALFRQYKDPQILSPRFEPVFRRLRPLLLSTPASSFRELADATSDLSSFIARFAMGDYYFGQLRALLNWEGAAGYNTENQEEVLETHRRRFIALLQSNLPAAIRLLVEQLRYQDWPPYEA